MHVTARSYLTAGVAVFGAGAIALSPVQPLPAELALAPQRVSAALAVELAAAVDPITRLVEVIQESADNVTALFGAVADSPLPIIEAVIANAGVYLSELPDVGAIVQQIVGNLGNAARAPFAVPASCLGEDVSACESISDVPVTTVPILGEISQRDVYALLPLLLGDSYESLAPILQFTTTPVSGVVLSLIGPVVAPVLSVVNSVTSVIDYLGASDFQSAVFELINLPTNAIGAFLNGGQFLDLAPVLSLLGVELPSEITSIGFQMGGLLSPGGVLFDGVAAEASIANPLAPLPPPTIDIIDPGLPVGPIGSLLGLRGSIADAIKLPPPPEPVIEEPPVEEGLVADRIAAPAAVVDSAPAPVVSEVAETVAAAEAGASDKPSPKRERRGAAARGADSAGASASTDGGDAKPSRAARRAG